MYVKEKKKSLSLHSTGRIDRTEYKFFLLRLSYANLINFFFTFLHIQTIMLFKCFFFFFHFSRKKQKTIIFRLIFNNENYIY